MLKRSDNKNRQSSDEELIDLYWARNEKAIDETHLKYGDYLFRIAYNILHDRLDCEECQNDTYLGLWNAMPPTRPVNFPAFSTQIMRRIAINRYKEKTRKKHIPSELTVSVDDIEKTLSANQGANYESSAEELGRLISAFVSSLPQRQRYIFIERYYMAEPVEAVAYDLGIGKSTVYRELDKLKSDLKRYLEINEVYI